MVAHQANFSGGGRIFADLDPISLQGQGHVEEAAELPFRPAISVMMHHARAAYALDNLSRHFGVVNFPTIRFFAANCPPSGSEPTGAQAV